MFWLISSSSLHPALQHVARCRTIVTHRAVSAIIACVYRLSMWRAAASFLPASKHPNLSASLRLQALSARAGVEDLGIVLTRGSLFKLLTRVTYLGTRWQLYARTERDYPRSVLAHGVRSRQRRGRAQKKGEPKNKQNTKATACGQNREARSRRLLADAKQERHRADAAEAGAGRVEEFLVAFRTGA